AFAPVAGDWRVAIGVLAVLSMTIGNLVAMYQTNIKRLLAYSSIAHVGYIVLGVGLANPTGVTGGILHMFNHALAKGAVFLALGCVAFQIGATQLDKLHGLGRRMPWTMGAFTVAAIGLIGLPPSIGFFSKYSLLRGVGDAGWPFAAVLLVSGLLNAAYFLPIIHRAFFRRDSRPDHLRPAGALQVAPMVAVAGLGLVLGLLSFLPGGLF
ncbi:monovalent cation/H+ antiporter subunit D family protein, partial [bacterium]|nr:monovalent cation/H+ antiporter subunit D family protein [bacterium]